MPFLVRCLRQREATGHGFVFVKHQDLSDMQRLLEAQLCFMRTILAHPAELQLKPHHSTAGFTVRLILFMVVSLNPRVVSV